MNIKIIRIDKSLPLPEYKTAGSVAFDIYSREDSRIQPKEIKILPSNLIIKILKGYFLLITARSSLVKNGLMLANSVGVIDQDYHGSKDEIGISVYNFTEQAVSVQRGDRLAQGLILPVERAKWEEEKNSKEVSRGGFGSTGL